MHRFLTALMESGRVEVSASGEALEVAACETDEVLRACDGVARQQLAFTPPPLHLAAARWAAELLYRACQALVYRHLDAATVRQSLAVPCPAALDASVVYSADLTLRYVPDLAALARGVAAHDVLVEELHRIAAAWPLSSVGMLTLNAEQLAAAALDIFVADDCLRQLYVDRVIARRDAVRLAHPAVAEGVRQALGMYTDLCPELTRSLEALTPTRSASEANG
ncbi:MAG TPA: hypothetical protein VF306_17185 [Pirellulales bacterium]